MHLGQVWFPPSVVFLRCGWDTFSVTQPKDCRKRKAPKISHWSYHIHWTAETGRLLLLLCLLSHATTMCCCHNIVLERRMANFVPETVGFRPRLNWKIAVKMARMHRVFLGQMSLPFTMIETDIKQELKQKITLLKNYVHMLERVSC